jgi:hypothetical protein
MRDKTMILRVDGDYGCHALSWRLCLKVNGGADPGGQKSPSVQSGDLHVEILHPQHRQECLCYRVRLVLQYSQIRLDGVKHAKPTYRGKSVAGRGAFERSN